MSQQPFQQLSKIQQVAVPWLWRPYIAAGKLALLDGDPGVGKSSMAIDLAARLSCGGPLPDGQPTNRSHVILYLSAEDNAADTLLPRAEAAGANLRRIVVAAPGAEGITWIPSFPDSLDGLETVVSNLRVDLLIVDPLSAYLAPGVSANNDQSVRRALLPLSDMAARTGCAVLLLRHLAKHAGSKAIYRGLGSIGITGSVRTGLLASRHPDDPTLGVLTHPKTNIGPTGPTLGYRLKTNTAGQSIVEWTGPVDLSADELCAIRESPAARPRERAVEWLRGELTDGPRKASELYAAAAKVGIAERTLDRAKKELDVKSERAGTLDWLWSDPAVRKPTHEPSLLPPLPDLSLDRCQSLDDVVDLLSDRNFQ